MKRPHQHVLRVEGDPTSFTVLVDAARDVGLRIGWLALEDVVPPPGLSSMADMGAMRAVAVGGGRTVAVKTLRGAPVLRDLLREHFRGCALVLVAGEGPLAEGLPVLSRAGDHWQVAAAATGMTSNAGAAASMSSADLVAALRRPRPW